MIGQKSRYDPAPMLTRLPAVPRRLSAKAVTHATRTAGRRQAVRVSLRRWLSAPGSLTARLRLHGKVTVQVLSQGRQTLWPQERAALRCQQGHVREVVLRIDGRPAVWARSSTTLRAVKGPWRAIKGLGTRPLAELLFEHSQVRRDPLVSQRFAQQAPERRHLARTWAGLLLGPALHEASHTPQTAPSQATPINAPPAWARHSVFWHRGHPLQVLESFAPWVTILPTHQCG
jgi:chorismate--pyruvate lyase